MKRLLIFIFSIFLFIEIVSATQVWIEGANVTVNQFIEKIEIIGKDGYFKDVGYLSIPNSELNKTLRIVLPSPFLEGFNKGIKEYNFSACSAETRYAGGNFFKDYNWGLECRKNIIDMNVDNSPTDYLIFDINLSQMEWGENELKDETKGVYFQFVYMLEDFVISNEGEYNFLWIKGLSKYYQSSIELKNPSIVLVLPSRDTIIESLGTFQPYEFDENKRMVLVYGNAISDNFLSYRDAKIEKENRFTRDIVILVLTLGASIVFGFIFSDKYLTKRTKNLWITTGALLFILGYLMLKESYPRLQLAILLLFILSFCLTLYSTKTDKPKCSPKKDLISIYRLIVEILKS